MSGKVIDIQVDSAAINLDLWKSEFIETVSLRYSKKVFSDVWLWVGRIDYRNLDQGLSGEKRFEGAELSDVLKDIQDFIKHMDGKD